MNTEQSSHEKKAAALNSVAAAFFLTSLKVVVGLLSGSLGILAEAAHSGLDFAAAIVTYIAVRVSGKPADREHPYGHGKVENLSALVETILLLVTCGWIIYESVHRLTSKKVDVDASFWAFAVMVISIMVDVSRSRMLYRMARKHRSQALEADALHFSTDVWSSVVVIVGLLGVKLAGWYPGLEFLQKADAVAALVVAMIVVFVSAQLGLRTIQTKQFNDQEDQYMDEKDEAVSFFVGTDASKNTPVMHLIGDRNLIGQENKDCPAAEVSAGITHLEHDTPQPRWDKDLHREAGNIALGDGSAQQLSQAGLLAQLAQQNSNPNHDNCILKPKPPHSTAGNHLRTFLAITD